MRSGETLLSSWWQLLPGLGTDHFGFRFSSGMRPVLFDKAITEIITASGIGSVSGSILAPPIDDPEARARTHDGTEREALVDKENSHA